MKRNEKREREQLRIRKRQRRRLSAASLAVDVDALPSFSIERWEIVDCPLSPLDSAGDQKRSLREI